MLSTEVRGKGPPVVAVHGFTQTRRSWDPIVDRLGDQFRFTVVDAPGHGGSAGVRAGLWEAAGLLGDVGGGASYLGYSMGGRLCLHLALARPDLVHALILVGTHPGIADPTQRWRRHADDHARAQRLLDDGVPAFVDWWLQQPLFSTLDPAAANRADRLTNRAEGLASSLLLVGTGSQESLWGRLPELDMPVLLVAGETDERFVGLARQAAEAIGANAEVVLIPGAGHACHLERPASFCLVVADFLDSAGH